MADAFPEYPMFSLTSSMATVQLPGGYGTREVPVLLMTSIIEGREMATFTSLGGLEGFKSTDIIDLAVRGMASRMDQVAEKRKHA